MERGQPAKAQAAYEPSDHNDDLMGQATKCVRKFAPNGRKRMQSPDNGHITACKISDANPNELLASWSGDHIYSFDIVRTPDASSFDNYSDKSQSEGFPNLLQSKSRSFDSDQKTKTVLSNGRPAGSQEPKTDLQIGSAELAKCVTKLRKHIFNLDPSDLTVAEVPLSAPAEYTSRDASTHVSRESSEPSGVPSTHDPSDLSQVSAALGSTLELSTKCLTDMDDIMRTWRYPLNPTEEEVMLQQTLRDRRNACWRFVQAIGTLSRILLILCSTSDPEPNPFADRFRHIGRGPDERTSVSKYDFLKAILLWVEGGPEAVIEGFEGASTQPRESKDFAVPTGVGLISLLDDHLIPYLLLVAGEKPVVDVDTSRFEKDEHRQIFETETLAVEAFARVARMPIDHAHQTASTGTQTQKHPAALPTQKSKTSAHFWGFKVGRGLLLNAGDGINHAFVDVAFGGTGRVDVEDGEDEGEGRSQRDILVKPGEEMAVMQDIMHGAEYRQPDGHNHEGLDENNDSDNVDSSNSDNDDDNASNELRSRLLWQAGRGNSRKAVEVDVDCSPYVRKYSGHCNVKTVKDVNFFGLQDDYVVSGSDCGNLFIWDKRTSQLFSILSADSEVVNVVQGELALVSYFTCIFYPSSRNYCLFQWRYVEISRRCTWKLSLVGQGRLSLHFQSADREIISGNAHWGTPDMSSVTETAPCRYAFDFTFTPPECGTLISRCVLKFTSLALDCALRLSHYLPLLSDYDLVLATSHRKSESVLQPKHSVSAALGILQAPRAVSVLHAVLC